MYGNIFLISQSHFSINSNFNLVYATLFSNVRININSALLINKYAEYYFIPGTLQTLRFKINYFASFAISWQCSACVRCSFNLGNMLDAQLTTAASSQSLTALSNLLIAALWLVTSISE